ncbi:hypothetical protein PENARI_c024G01498 [Penicillium arizonense]|uniref:Uncharacterized protein n=1 Tax=Penicillium arizonense TaxID=1835702 RepID=A0A1F5L764_PENAI|nr:hypothetical protein PENARI_c024G01498 [Penicillium arizonense]OGE49045.1 hypothetical protein PENARI_c024G01498 [Penicillium arizonense]
MKLSHIVTVSALIAGASARGIRGASERAFYFSTYVSEEIFTDASKRTVATGCEGTREGLRGQQKRCTFIEFCDHLWHETEIPATGEMDKRPDITKTYMGTAIDKNKLTLLNYGPAAMRDGIMNLRMKLDNGKTANVPKWGYYGDLNIANLVAGGTADNYFDKVGQEFAERYWKAKEEFDIVSELTGDNKLSDELKDLMLDASEVVWGEPYKVYDKDATATKLAATEGLGLTKEQALTLLTTVYNELQETDLVKEHQRALAGAKKAMNVASSGCI